MSVLRYLLACCVLFGSCCRCYGFERYECTERWYLHSIAASVHLAPDRTADCRNLAKKSVDLGWYVIVDGKAYWRTVTKERHSPCAGIGPGALGNLLDPVCYLPSGLQIHENDEVREFWRVSDDGEHFRLAYARKENPGPWQKDAIRRYAVDARSVYLNSEKIDGADPATFEVIFPFGDDPKWQSYSVARDRDHLYVDGWIIPTVDLEHVVWLDLPCQEVGMYSSCKDTAYAAASIGRIGRDLLFLHYGSRPTVFRGLATDDVSCFRRDFSHYCRIRNGLYLIQPEFEEEARLVPKASDSE